MLSTARLVYFFFYAAWASLLPFLPLFYRSRSLSGPEIGLLTGIVPLITLAGAPFWGGVADASQRHRTVLLGVMAGSLAAAALLLQMSSMAGLVVFAAAYAFFNAPVIPLIDTSVLALLGARRPEYGKTRLWGAVGWGLAAPFAGWLASRLGGNARFALYAVLMLACIFAATRLPVARTAIGRRFWDGVGVLLRDRRWLVFLLAVFVGGVGAGMVNNYLFLYLAELNASQTVMGLALSMATVSEVPALFFSGWLLRKLGPRGMLLMALSVYAFRLLAYSLVSAPWLVLLIQLTHGLTFASLWAAGVSYAGILAPKGLEATAQGLFNAILMGFGSFSGAMIGGLLFDSLGGKGLYRTGAWIVLGGLLLFWAASARARPPDAREENS